MLSEFAKKDCFQIVGLMSGTSHDGVDAAVVEIKAGNPIELKVIKHIHIPYDRTLRDAIRHAFAGDTEHICRLNFTLGEVFSRAALKVIALAGVNTKDIDCIASHGQTICHVPPKSGRKHSGSTLQIGESAVIAQRTGIITVSGFRTKDMAAGGEGAPLVPLADYLLFKKSGATRAVLNIGGMANVTILRERPQDTIAFDTGPGNSLMDEVVRHFSHGKKTFDKNGSMAKKGRLNEDFLHELLAHPYYKRRPPKSTGRELFGTRMAEDIISRCRHLPHWDILSTLAHLTARSIAKSIAPYKPDELIAAGGGSKNPFLMDILRELLQGVRLSNISEYGIDAEAKEAVCFAILGMRTLKRMPGNLPSATGAEREVILGEITLPN
ncbi:anhydro-N-acetylmuramic acid kinase [Candidatus Magnetominusculus xianensis]|uniref:Anhydro-N-acetylmuramic acid kinase n=1 Tax=Candidatus Magnetominusculus xianensis TaxID=1748249 RepID=A0ABR5SKP4_9BACT|nr:anhydro-N-acetylmuramic acid kinase [Candidatus Magnetominusculus xianensis]KWT88353.1 anhydro-N-acetylmuramic acid kinase [Candidatus Magnetominusculus xianensis]MBF0405442.1 anhydro-N-acetylmuramic acid kinase [Nitrospirota bacterium]